jgi:hypothetical protein
MKSNTFSEVIQDNDSSDLTNLLSGLSEEAKEVVRMTSLYKLTCAEKEQVVTKVKE